MPSRIPGLLVVSGVMLTLPAVAAPAPGWLSLPGHHVSGTTLISDGTGGKKSSAPSHSGRSEGGGNAFDKFGHSVASGAKGVGHSVEGGAKDFGRSVVKGWESFRRNFHGRR
jgi:hypothetical protein